MHQEDLKNLMGWLQAIYKETEATRGATLEMRRNVDMIPDLKRDMNHEGAGTSDTDRRVEEAKNHLEVKMKMLEDALNDIKRELRDIHSKLDHIK